MSQVRQSHIYLVIKENKEVYADPVELTCSLLGVSRAAYYRWLSGKKCARELENEKIAEIMEQNRLPEVQKIFVLFHCPLDGEQFTLLRGRNFC